jgi:arylsulfatase A-like enzyme
VSIISNFASGFGFCFFRCCFQLLILVALTLTTGCRRSENRAAHPAARDASVLLITLDTTRADSLGTTTPHLNTLAARGVRFANATVQVPLTLPSHASIMTGTYPIAHGLRHMEGFVLDKSHRTIASSAQAHGFATAAFLGSRVLAKEFGFASGFAVYDDDMGGKPFDYDVPGVFAERRASEVTDHALAWLN